MNDQDQPSIRAHDAAAWRNPPTGRAFVKEPVRWKSLAAGLGAVVLVFGGLSYAGYRQALIASGAPDPAIEAEGREYIANLLRDPASAQFRKVQVQGECVDGEVNGKNAFGGNAGFSEFYYNRKQGAGQIAPDSDGVLKVIDPLQGAIVEANFGFGHGDCLAGRAKQ
ncbi:hypothetical protein O6V14_09465 [Sphingomonas faeni]|uniref:hypothetical protein n=1 Tax=Sphingomonas faeni TaxID=185950 RepID=UPI003359E0BA